MSNLEIVEKIISSSEKIVSYVKDLDYDSVNLKVVWETISDDLPQLIEELKKCKG